MRAPVGAEHGVGMRGEQRGSHPAGRAICSQGQSAQTASTAQSSGCGDSRTALSSAAGLGGKENNTGVGKQQALGPVYLPWALILLEDTPPPCAARRSRNSSNN